MSDDSRSDQGTRVELERKLNIHRREFTDPDKHYVRQSAWLPAARNRLEENKTKRKQFLRYFTLCAAKAIDVSLFWEHELVEFDGREYPGVVFCENNTDVYATIRGRLGNTIGFHAEFQDLVLERETQKSTDFYSELGLQFDVFNLDFTGMCFPSGEPPYSRTLEAIVQLITHLSGQPKCKGFDMFFTFRAQKSAENNEAITTLKGNLRENRTHHPFFKDALQRDYDDNIGVLADRQYHKFLLLALPKYIGRIGHQSGLRVRCTHRLHVMHEDATPPYHIISFGLSFDPTKIGQAGEGLRQTVTRDEISIRAYIEMLQDLVGTDAINVSSTQLNRAELEKEVQNLIEATENPVP